MSLDSNQLSLDSSGSVPMETIKEQRDQKDDSESQSEDIFRFSMSPRLKICPEKPQAPLSPECSTTCTETDVSLDDDLAAIYAGSEILKMPHRQASTDALPSPTKEAKRKGSGF